MTKLALHEAGYAVAHLSRDTHGFSTTRFGRRVLNPIQTRVERRYLAERLVMSDERSVGPLRELAARLKQNRLVSITLAREWRRTRLVPFLDGYIRIATGALALAWPDRRTDPAGLHAARARRPLRDPDRGGAPRRPGAGARCRDRPHAGALCRLLETYVLRSPDQFALPYLSTEQRRRASAAQ